MHRRLLVSLFLLALVGCDSDPEVDAGVDAGVGTDGGTSDGGEDMDSGTVVDAGVGMDAGDVDGGGTDGGGSDGGGSDAGAPDAGTPDAGMPDAGMPDAGMPDAGPSMTCTPSGGDFSATISGPGPLPPFFFRFRADGVWLISTISRADLAVTTNTGTWTYVDPTLTITEDFGCMATEVGQYTLAWDATCTNATWTLVSDACTSRGMALGGATMMRLP